MIKERGVNMNAIKAVTTNKETRREFHVPTITTTEPVQMGKEIDLSFWENIERNRRATEYSQNVARLQKSRTSRVKRILSGLLAGTCMVCFSVGFFIIGLYF